MALISKRQEAQTDINQANLTSQGAKQTASAKQTLRQLLVHRWPKKREMKITWPSLLVALKDSFEFTLFAVTGGAACWGLSWIVSQLVAYLC